MHFPQCNITLSLYQLKAFRPAPNDSALRDKNHVNEMYWKTRGVIKIVGQQEGSRFMNERARPAKRVEVSSQQSEVRDGVSWRTNQIESKRIASHRFESRRIKSNPMEWQTQSGAIISIFMVLASREQINKRIPSLVILILLTITPWNKAF